MICAPRYSFYHYFCKTKFIKWELPLYDLCSAAQFLLLLLQNKIHKVEMATFATAAHTPVFTIQLDRSASLCCQLLPDFVSLACCSAHRGRLEVCSRRGIERMASKQRETEAMTGLSDLADLVGFNPGPVRTRARAKRELSGRSNVLAYVS